VPAGQLVGAVDPPGQYDPAGQFAGGPDELAQYLPAGAEQIEQFEPEKPTLQVQLPAAEHVPFPEQLVAALQKEQEGKL
jgi:hypothetical protein